MPGQPKTPPMKTGKLPFLVLAATAAPMSAAGSRQHQADAPFEKEPQTNDVLTVKTSATAYVFPGSYGRSAEAFIRRIENMSETPDGSVQAAVLDNGTAASLDDRTASDILRLIARGGCVVYCEPTASGLDAFFRKMREAEEDFYRNPSAVTADGMYALNYINRLEEGNDGLLVPAFIDENDSDGILCDILAVKGNSRYVIADLDDNSSAVTETAGEASKSIIQQTGAVSDYVYGLHADGLAAWVDDKESSAEAVRKGNALLAANDSQELDKITDAQKITYSFNVCAGYKCAPLTVSYEIWTANDTKGSDYYLVHQELRIENSKLECGPEDTGMNQWSTYRVQQAFAGLGKDVRAYWAYMSKLGTQAEFSDSDAAVEHVSPANNISGVSSYTENLTWSMEGAFVPSTHPEISLSGNVSMSKSWTHSIPDLGMTFTYDRNRPKWEYAAGVLPKLTRDKFCDPRHDLAKPILKNDCTVGHSWIWKISGAGTYSFNSKVWADLQGLYVDYNDAYQKKNKYKTFSTQDSKRLSLNPPPRFRQEWLMTMSPYSDKTAKLMSTYFPEYWLPSFSLYTVEEDDTASIDAQIAATQSVIEENRALLEENGVESFKLSWKLVHGSEIYRTYDYTAGDR